MNRYSIAMLASHPLRLLLTIGGVALCVTLMLFLLSTYRGVADGSVEYIRQNRADLWVLQRNAWNILRGSSLLSTDQGRMIRTVPGVVSASPVLLLLSAIKNGSHQATVYLAGFNPKSGIGGPPHIVAGRSVVENDEIVLDRSFAKKYHFKVGDSIQIQDKTFGVVGISGGTNAFVIQYAFITLESAQCLIEFSNLVTCYLVKVKLGAVIPEVSERIRREVPGVEVYDHWTFLQNNIREMQSGFLPFIYTVAAIGIVVSVAILSLLLTVNIVEKRKDFAVMKTLGSPETFLAGLIIEQALLISFTGSVVALLFFFPLVAFIEKVSPEISTKSTPEQFVGIILTVLIVSIISAMISMQRLRRIYPLEAFS
jgi:putative ABC transport system permease protein